MRRPSSRQEASGEGAPNCPPTAQDYAAAGLPWFEWYGNDQAALPGSEKLAGVTSVGAKFKQKTGATLPNSGDVATPAPKPLGPGQHAADIEPVPVVDLAISAPAAATPMTTETPRPRRR